MSISPSTGMSVESVSPKLDLSNAAKLPAKKRRSIQRLGRKFRALSFALAVAALSATAHAATEYWDTGAGGTTIATQGSGTWSTTATNWESTSPTKIGWTNGNVAVFATAGATVSSTINTNAGTTDATIDSINVSLGQSGLIASQLFFNNTGFVITAATAQTLTISNTGTTSIAVANGKSASLGSNATINLVSTNAAASNIVTVGGAAGGSFNVESGGTLSYFAGGTVGGNGQFSFRTAGDLAGESGTINVAGTLAFSATTPTSQISLGQTNGAVTMNVNNGGLVSSASTGAANNLGSLLLSNNGATAILNINSGGTVTLSGTASTAGLNVARGSATTGSGTVNLNGGTLTTARLFSGTALASSTVATSTFNFNGGTLTADVNNTTDFMKGLTRANVRDGGAVIDTAGFNVTIGQALVHSNVTGNNPNTGAPDQATDGGLTKRSLGTLTLNGVNTYTGATAVTAGTLALGGGGSLAGTAVTAGTATTAGTLQINGAYTIGTSGSPSVTLTANNAALSLQDTTINTLTINTATAGATALTINGGNTLSFDAGATTGDLINLGTGLLATASGTNTVNINLLARPTGTQTLTLINAPGGFTGSANFTLGTVSGAATAANTFGLSLSLASTATQLQLVETATAAPATAYFTGSMGASWAANNGTIGNFSTDSAGTTGVTQLPGATTDVHFYATNANTANVAASTLDSVFSIKTLTVDGSTLGESAPVGIAPGTGGSLTITPTDPLTGITVNGGAGAVTISAPVTLGAAQTWTNNSANLLTVSGAITNGANTLTLAGSGNTTLSGVIGAGAGGLIMNGTGTLTLSGTNTYTGGTTANAGIVAINSNASLGANASSVTLNGGTVSTTVGFTDTHAFTIGASGGTINVNAGTQQLYFHTANSLLGSGPLSLTGSGTLVASSGNLRVDATNTYSGTLTASGGGIFEYGVAGAVATGASLAVGNQGEIALQGSPGVTLPNAIAVSGGTNSVLSFENGTAGIYSGGITLNANATIGLRDWYNYATVRGGTISGVLSGPGGLSVNSGTGTGGTLTLSGPNTFDGAVAINASTIIATNATALGSTVGGTTVNSGAALDVRAALGNEAVTISGTGVAAGGALITGTGTGSLAGPVTLAANSSIGGAGALTLSGVIGDGGLAFGVTKVGAGTTTLTGTSTYTGTTTISAGTLQIGDGTTDGSISSTANIVDNAALVYNRSTGSNFTYGGVISGTGTLTNAGPGTQTLAAAETYTGTTSVTAGTLNVTGTLGNTAVTVSAGTLGLQNAGAISQNTLTVSGTGVLNETVANAISGTAALAVQTAATTTISLANNYSGNTTIGAGQATAVLRASASGALGTGTLALDSAGNASTARLELIGGITLANALNFTGRNNVSAGIENISGNNTLSGNIALGTGGGSYYVQSDADLLTLSGNLTPPGSGTRTLNLTGAGNGLISGALQFTTGNILGVTQSGAGTWTLTGANAYTGVTTISNGTLAAASTTGNALASTASIAVNGGGTLLLSQPNQVLPSAVASTTAPAASVTLGVAATSVGNVTVAAGASQGTAATASGGTITGATAQGLGALTLNNAATLTFGGASTTLVFNTFTPNGNVLTIAGYGNANFNSGTMTSGSGTDDRLVFFGDQTSNFADFNFGGGAGVGVSEVALDNGFFEVSGTAVPEPTTVLGGLLLVATAGYRQRRRLSSGWQAVRRSF